MAEDSPRRNGVKVRLLMDGANRPPGKNNLGYSRYRVLGHDSRLAQVMTNLIDNARSFSEPGGEVRVALLLLAGQPSDGERGDEIDRVQISVEDDGPGIPPAAIDRIFERFYTDRPNQGFGQNSGLGLSISRQIIEAHGGRIWAENRPATPNSGATGASALAGGGQAEKSRDEDDKPVRHGAGARFIISLPAARE
jgi:two-component system sensor histidine kinase ChvG